MGEPLKRGVGSAGRCRLTVEEYLSGIAQQIVHELEPILKVKEVTINSALLGSYTEAAVRRLIQRVVAPMHVSTGAVIDYPMPDQLRQIDVIVCEPFPAPAVFEGGEFALVPRSSAFGIMEIKRSNYSDIDHELEEFATDAPKIAATPHPDVGDTRPPGMALCVYSTENLPPALPNYSATTRQLPSSIKRRRTPLRQRCVQPTF